MVLTSLLLCLLALTGAATAIAGQSTATGKLSGPRGVVPARAPTGGVLSTPFARVPRRRTRGGALTQPRPVSPLTKVAIPKLDYHGGPVMHSNHIYVIFWQPSSLPTGVEAFSAHSAQHVSYVEAVDNYFEAVAHDSGKFSNAYSVATQYGAGTPEHIEYASSFDAATQTTLDTDAYPKNECVDDEPLQGGGEKGLPVCLDETELEAEIQHVIEAKHWPTGLEDLYFLYTPKGVGGCFAAGEESTKGGSCSYSYYCAYHYNFPISAQQTIFADMPYETNFACNDGAEPEGSDAGPAIDASSHEHNEAITDPTGLGWWDGDKQEIEEAEHGGSNNLDYGEEVADLCLPETFSASYNEEVYGPLLGGAGYETPNAFNQVIDGRDYLLQREWSANALASGGACVQRLLPAAFTPPAGTQIGQPAVFDGSASGIAEYPIVSWHWSFGDGSSETVASPTTMHTYATEGDYTVTLTVKDADGDTATVSQQITVAPAQVTTTSTSDSSSTSSSTTLSTTSTTTTETTSAPATSTSAAVAITTSTSRVATVTGELVRLTNRGLADQLGLPGGTATLTGTGTVSLGHAVCPAACTVNAAIYATVHSTRRGHRISKRELIGSAHAVGAGAPISLKLNATGLALLRHNHHLTVQLVITIQGSQGARHITRTLTLTTAQTPRRG